VPLVFGAAYPLCKEPSILPHEFDTLPHRVQRVSKTARFAMCLYLIYLALLH